MQATRLQGRQTYSASPQHGAAARRLISSRPCQATAQPGSSTSSSGSSWQSPLPLLGTLACSLLLAGSAHAAPKPPDNAAVGKCLLSSCQGALAGCLADGGCLQNLVCLNACGSAPDVTACQIRCGDLYADKAIDVFNSCAVSAKK
jgi:hypothetical protein